MPTQLNIKNPRTVELASELARRTGESVTAAVTRAIEDRLERTQPAPRFSPEEREARIAAVLAIGDEVRRWHDERSIPIPTQAEMDAEMYDEDGLPR